MTEKLHEDELKALDKMFRTGDGKQPWTAAIKLGDFVESDPHTAWPFVIKWGCAKNEDTRAAVATCLLEHVLEYHFEEFFPKVKELALEKPTFAATFKICSKFGQSEEPVNSKRWNALERRLQ